MTAALTPHPERASGGRAVNWTKLRHEMLTAISEGRVIRGLGASGWAIGGKLRSGYGRSSNTVTDLVHADLAQLDHEFEGPRYRTPVVLTESGELALTVWSAKHPMEIEEPS